MQQAFSKIWTPIIIIAVLGGGFFAWQYFGAPKEEKATTPEEKIMYEKINTSCCGAPEPSYTTMKIGLREGSLGGWNTLTIYEYDGYKVGFSIDYPPEYEVSYGAINDAPICAKWPRVTFFSPEKREFSDYGEQEIMRVDIDSCVKLGWAATFQKWIDSEKGGLYPAEGEENIVVDNKPAVKLIDTSVSGVGSVPNYKERRVSVYINRDEKVAYNITADIDFEKQDIYLPIFNQMLSTFKFIGAEETDCDKWRKECTKEGEFSCGPCDCRNCCEGLVSRQVTYPWRTENNEVVCKEEMANTICVKCGDGICGKEDWCICPEDCQKPNAEGLPLITP